VLDRGYLLEHDLSFELQVLLPQRGVQDQVRQHIECGVQMLVEDPGVIGGVLPRRVRIERSAEAFDHEGDVPRAPPRGPLEDHVLDEMARAELRRRLVHRAAPDPYAYGHRADPRHLLTEHQQSARKFDAGESILRHFCSCSTALRDRRSRPFSSIERSLTLVVSPFLSTSSVLSVRPSWSSEMWHSPSTPGRISMNAPKEVVLLTTPS